ncbi:MBL fold metallo-hydrolase [Roseobacter sp. HKCCD7870]|uniref:MBL fold metallo-hydrolase n=1 Tax=Roseobacter sp. HKCCD7870 TaxID=3120343 RepID=UPI0030ED6B3D
MSNKVVLMGVKGGPAIRPNGPMPTSSLLEIAGRSCVVDCGLGVSKGLVQTGLSLKSLDLIFITHLHSDHILELGGLIHTAWTSGLATPVHVYGPIGIGAVWEGFLAALAFDIDLRIDDEGRPDLRGLVTITEYDEGIVANLPNGLVVRALRVDHPPIIDCFALRFDSPDWSVCFSADTAYFPPLADFARGCDLLIHEAMLEAGVDRLVARTTGDGAKLKAHIARAHTEARDAAEIAQAAGVPRLALHHLVPADDPEITTDHWRAACANAFSGEIIIGYDGCVIKGPNS